MKNLLWNLVAVWAVLGALCVAAEDNPYTNAKVGDWIEKWINPSLFAKHATPLRSLGACARKSAGFYRERLSGGARHLEVL